MLTNNYVERYEYVDLNGNPVKRPPDEYPYSYDEHVLFKSNDYREDDSWVYSDRMMEWDWAKFNRCVKEIWHDESQYFSHRKPKDIERFLSMYHDKEVHLTAVLQGCNVSNGYPYWVFAFRVNEKE